MYHFFVTPDQVKEGYIFIIGSDVNHIKNVLRMKPGEKIEISDGNNRKYICRLEQFRQGEIAAAIEEEQISDTELSSKIYLFQGVPKSDKMEFIIQKAVELGVYKVIPMMTKRTVVKLDEKSNEKGRTLEFHFRECSKAVRKKLYSRSGFGCDTERGFQNRRGTGYLSVSV